jgi:hypothetical protein
LSYRKQEKPMPTQKLRVGWIPQVPGKPFHVEVATLVEAKLLLEALADFDQFQLDNRIKGDYCNCGGLEVWNEDDNDWEDWFNEDCDREIDDYTLEELREMSVI